MTDRLEALERLGRLRDQGLLTDEEFAQEKARVLAGDTTTAPIAAAQSIDGSAKQEETPIGAPHQASSDAAVPVAMTPQNPVADDLQSILRPISSVADASQQVNRVWAVATLLIGGEIISEIGRISQNMAGHSWASPVSMGDELLTSAIGLTVSTVVAGLLSLWIARRASRVGVVILGVLTLSAVLWPFIDPEPTRLMVKVGTAALAGLALWYLIGVARGAFWLNGRRPLSQATPARGTGELKMTMADARAKAAPVRRLIGWIGLVWLVVFLLGGVWFWLKTNGSTEPSTGTSAANAQSGPPSSGAAGAPADQLQQILTGTWVEEGAYCASYMALRFASDGQVYAEGTFGTWAVRGSQLDITIQSIDMDQVTGPVTYMGGRLQLVNRDEFHLTYPDGSGTRYRRCMGDQEPWRAPQTTTGEFHPLG